jgi:hypothetical protein
MNMLKLLQEVRELAQFAARPTEIRPAVPLLLQFRGARLRRAILRRKRFIRIDMQELPDIPQSVPITYLRTSR